MNGWLIDKSVAARPELGPQLDALSGSLRLCSVAMLEQLVSARSARDYDVRLADTRERFPIVRTPPDLLDRALPLQRDLAHHHGMWHRTPIPGLLIAETALHHDLGVLHVDRDFKRIAEVRPLRHRRLRLP